MGFSDLVGGKLGAAIGASVLLHAGLLGSLDSLIGGAAVSGAPDAPALHARIVTLAESAPSAPADVRAAADRRGSELATPQALPLLSGPQYFTADELDQRPFALTNITLDYPAGVPPREVLVVARILINETGDADEVQILSDGTEGGFERVVKQAFGGASYRPGRRGGKAVKSQIKIEVKFVPESTPAEAGPT